MEGACAVFFAYEQDVAVVTVYGDVVGQPDGFEYGDAFAGYVVCAGLGYLAQYADFEVGALYVYDGVLDVSADFVFEVLCQFIALHACYFDAAEYGVVDVAVVVDEVCLQRGCRHNHLFARCHEVLCGQVEHGYGIGVDACDGYGQHVIGGDG